MNQNESKVASRMLFIGYYDISKIISAPQVRISSMMKAFKYFGGTEVIVGNPRARAWMQLKWIFQLHSKNIQYAYVENSTSTAWPLDLLFLMILRMKGVKIGIFIRDVYPTFSYFKSRISWYQKPLYWGWHVSVWFYVKLAHHIFLPTEDIAKFVSPRPLNFSSLPPAMAHEPLDKFDISSNRFLYLGGISELYGLEILVKCLDALSVGKNGAGIDFITREHPPKLMQISNAYLESMSYHDITKRENKYLAGIIATHEPYSQFAVNVKLFDYLSLGLPVIITNMKGNVKIVKDVQAGLIAESPDDLPAMLVQVAENPDVLLKYKQNINSKLFSQHSWIGRFQEVMDRLYMSSDSRRER